MKTITAFIGGLIFTFLMAFTFTQEKDNALSRVQKMSGKHVFMYSEPINEYDVAFEVKSPGIAWSSPEATPDGIANFVIKKAMKISKEQNKEFDGVIIGSGKIDIAIKFK
jgi:hypothetical protein